MSGRTSARVDDSDCVAFLQWALPRLGMRWAGFRRVRGQVCKRLRRRLAELGLADLVAYRAHLERDGDEWARLERLTHITISRFHRDRGTFAALWDEVLPALAAAAAARGDGSLRVWSAGCASGEEAYTVAIGWRLSVAMGAPGVRLSVLATDVDEAMLARARRGCYAAGSLRELPESWRVAAFSPSSAGFCLREEFRGPVSVARHDVRADPVPEGRYAERGVDLVRPGELGVPDPVAAEDLPAKAVLGCATGAQFACSRHALACGKISAAVPAASPPRYSGYAGGQSPVELESDPHRRRAGGQAGARPRRRR
jgi:chemotaxis protein methyltransferase CheR